MTTDTESWRSASALENFSKREEVASAHGFGAVCLFSTLGLILTAAAVALIGFDKVAALLAPIG